MNTATLSTPQRLPLYPLNFIRLGKLGVCLVGVLCASMLFGVYVIGKPQSAILLDGMLLLACAMQVLAVVFQGQSLGRGVSVLQMQRAPAALWRAWLRQWLWSVTRYWAVLAIALAMLMATPMSPRCWLMAPALLSVVLSICMVTALARAGLLPRRLGMAIEAALVALLAWAAAAGQFIVALEYIAALPAWVLAPCTLAWPAMAYWVMHLQADALRSVTGAQSNVLRRMRDAVARWAGRFQPLRESGANDEAYPVNRRTLLVVAIMQNVIFFGQLVPVHWGDEGTVMRLARLALICAICSSALLVRDLHWRALLLPGGTQLRRIGTRILLSTMAFQAPLVLVFAIGSVLMSPLPEWGWRSLAGMAIPLLELACCTSLMTAMRALPRRWQTTAAMTLAGVMICAYLPKFIQLNGLQWVWHIGSAYALLLIVLTCMTLAVANRCWTPKRLLQAMSFN